jgi:hemerythrin
MLRTMSLDNAALANKLLKFLVHWLACHILGTARIRRWRGKFMR